MSDLRVWTSNDFSGFWPVGSALVVVAPTRKAAIDAAQVACARCGLTFDGTVDELPLTAGESRVLCDGDYWS